MATFKPRMTAPSSGDKHWIHYTKGGYATACMINEKNGDVLANCVGYNNGRILEIMGKKEADWKIPVCNAEDCLDQAKKAGYKTGTTPKLGASIVWSKGKKGNGNDGCGHIMVVEEIKSNGDIVCSGSNYGGTRFYTGTYTKASNYKFGSSYKFEGFIYYGYEFDAPKTDDSKNTTTTTIKAGQKVVLNNTPCYNSESDKTPSGKKSGTYYLWDATVKNNRIRITNSTANVGKAGQVTCWCNVADLNLTAAKASSTATTSTTTSKSNILTSSSYPDYTGNKSYKVMKKPNDWDNSIGCYSKFSNAYREWSANKSKGYHLYDNNWKQLD